MSFCFNSSRKPAVALAAGGLLLIATSSSLAEDCNELIRLGLYNVQNSVSEHDSLTAAYRHFCQESYASSSSSRQGSMKASFSVLNIFSIGGGGGSGSSLTQTQWERICEDESLREELYTYDSIQSQTIFQGSLDAWEQCLALNERGLKTDIRPTSDLTGVSFDLYWTGSSKADFLGIDQPDLGQAQCTVTTSGKNGLSAEPVTPSSRLRLSSSAANFSCQRQLDALSDGSLAAEALRLTVKTSDGSFDIDMPPLALRQVSIGEMDGIYDAVASLEGRLNNELVRIESGEFRVTYKGPLYSGLGHRYQCVDIQFERPFTELPSTSVGINMLDVWSDRNLRLKAEARHVTRSGFELCAHTWADSRTYGVELNWLAYGN